LNAAADEKSSIDISVTLFSHRSGDPQFSDCPSHIQYNVEVAQIGLTTVTDRHNYSRKMPD